MSMMRFCAAQLAEHGPMPKSQIRFRLGPPIRKCMHALLRADPNDYPTQSRTAPGYPGRDNYYPPKEAQPRPSSLPWDTSPPGPPQVDPRYYPSSPHQAAQRQDVPPTPGTRAPRYETVGRGGYRDASPERYDGGYRDGSQPDPRQKNSMIGAV